MGQKVKATQSKTNETSPLGIDKVFSFPWLFKGNQSQDLN